jgi:type I restriction enzyme S subunit
MTVGVPRGWIEIELGDHVYIAGRIGWRGLKADEYTPSGPIFLSVPNLNHGDVVDFSTVNHISRQRYEESPEIKLKRGDTLLVKDGAGIGKLGYVQELPADATVNSSLLVVRPSDSLLIAKYLFYYLKGPLFQNIALQRITGSATPHLFQKDIKFLRILVPPAAEQKRIVTALEQILPRIEASQRRLERIATFLKRFRQSILSTTLSGDRTAEWRDANNTSLQDWQALPLAKLLAEPLANGRSVPDGENGFPVLRLTCLRNGHIDLRERKIGSWTAKEAARYRVTQGDFLVSRGNGSRSLIGRGGLVREKPDPVAYPDTLIRIRVRPTAIEPVFLSYLWSSRTIRDQIESAAHTTAGIWKISQGDLERFVLPVPTLAEQREIVRQIEKSLTVADRIETRYREAKIRVDRLSRSVLARAFRGELVAPEFELAGIEGQIFESAEELLAKIARAEPEPKSRKKAARGGR